MSAALQIGYYGERMKLLIRQGATLGPFFATMVNPNATRVNLTGCTIRGQIRKTALNTVIVETLNVTITNAVQGEYNFGLTDEETALIPAGETIKDEESIYQWDLELQDAAGAVIPLYYGECIVLREVTR